MRLSRPCYDKSHRCPGWAGGGMRSAKVDRCRDGRVGGGRYYEGPAWRWRFHRCDVCDVVTLPDVVRWLDFRWWKLCWDLRKLNRD
jgi:hypothetical protein